MRRKVGSISYTVENDVAISVVGDIKLNFKNPKWYLNYDSAYM